jgi:hypothetical protein
MRGWCPTGTVQGLGWPSRPATGFLRRKATAASPWVPGARATTWQAGRLAADPGVLRPCAGCAVVLPRCRPWGGLNPRHTAPCAESSALWKPPTPACAVRSPPSPEPGHTRTETRGQQTTQAQSSGRRPLQGPLAHRTGFPPRRVTVRRGGLRGGNDRRHSFGYLTRGRDLQVPVPGRLGSHIPGGRLREPEEARGQPGHATCRDRGRLSPHLPACRATRSETSHQVGLQARQTARTAVPPP